MIALLLLVALTGSASAAPQPHDGDPVFSPGGKAIAFVRWDGTGAGRVMVMRRDGRGLHAVTPSQPKPAGLAWSPDGRSLAYTSGRDIWRVDLGTSTPVNLTNSTTTDAWQPSWSPDGTRIAYDAFEFCFRCTALHVMNADGSDNRTVTDPRGSQARRPTWAPDGTTIALSLSAYLVVKPDGTPVAKGGGAYVSWFPDGKQLALIGVGGLRVHDLATGSDNALTAALKEYPMPSRDGSLVAGTGFRGALTIVRSGDGSVVRTIKAADMLNDAPSWGADDRIAFVHTGRCGIDIAQANGTNVHRLTRVC